MYYTFNYLIKKIKINDCGENCQLLSLSKDNAVCYEQLEK